MYTISLLLFLFLVYFNFEYKFAARNDSCHRGELVHIDVSLFPLISISSLLLSPSVLQKMTSFSGLWTQLKCWAYLPAFGLEFIPLVLQFLKPAVLLKISVSAIC